jgi:hypothetical protein
MCITRCPNVFISGVGLKLNFSAGINSAAATMFFENRAICPFTVVLTGFAIGPSSAIFCASAAGAACWAPATPAPINTAVAKNKLIRIFIFFSSFANLSRKHTPLLSSFVAAAF